MDALTHLFHHFHFQTHLFFSGDLCHRGQFNEANTGYLHFIRSGACLLHEHNRAPVKIEQASIVLSPSGIQHSIQPLEKSGVDVFCISFDFGKGILNPLTYTLHNTVILTLHEDMYLSSIADCIAKELMSETCGRQIAVHYLSAYFVVLIMRHCLVHKKIHSGLLLGLSDERLAKVLPAIHQYPERQWNITQMAQLAYMSRSRFSEHFKKIMNISPLAYLTNWRLAVAQNKIRQQIPLSIIAEHIGYQHLSTFSQVFKRHVGISPSEWATLYANKTAPQPLPVPHVDIM